MHRFIVVASCASIAAGAVVLAGGCGGVTGADLFGGVGGAGTGAAPTTSGHTSSHGVTTTATSSGQTTAQSSSSSATSTTASSSATSTTSTTSTTTTTTTTTTTSSGAPLPPVACAGGTCAAGEVCCFNPTGPGDHCGVAGQCDPGYAQLSCSSPADCPGQICCASFVVVNNVRQYQGIACAATCDDPNGQLPICSAGDASACPPGSACVQSQLLGNGYWVCAN